MTPGSEDFTRLRTLYGERTDFLEVCQSNRPGALEEASRLASNGDWEKILAKTEPWVKSCPVDVNAHYLAAGALLKLGREPEAQEHIRWYRGLMGSILTSGDGQAPETAYVVISIPEEYAVLRAVEVRPRQQERIDGGIDAFTVESAGGTSIIYFNPAADLRRRSRETGDH